MYSQCLLWYSLKRSVLPIFCQHITVRTVITIKTVSIVVIVSTVITVSILLSALSLPSQHEHSYSCHSSHHCQHCHNWQHCLGRLTQQVMQCIHSTDCFLLLWQRERQIVNWFPNDKNKRYSWPPPHPLSNKKINRHAPCKLTVVC